MSRSARSRLTSVLLVLLFAILIFYAYHETDYLAAFSRVHPRFQTPYIPTAITGIAVGVTAALLPIEEIAELTNIGTLFAFVLVCAGVWILRNREPGLKRPFRTPLVPLVPIPGMSFCAYRMSRLPMVTWIVFSCGWLWDW